MIAKKEKLQQVDLQDLGVRELQQIVPASARLGEKRKEQLIEKAIQLSQTSTFIKLKLQKTDSGRVVVNHLRLLKH
jgi:hypothetical protein